MTTAWTMYVLGLARQQHLSRPNHLNRSQEVSYNCHFLPGQNLHSAPHDSAHLHRNGDDELAALASMLRVLGAFAQLVRVCTLGLVRALGFVESHLRAVRGEGRGTPIVCAVQQRIGEATHQEALK